MFFSVKVKVKSKAVTLLAMKEIRGEEIQVPLILNFGAIWG
jgi:hypothetical protein